MKLFQDPDTSVALQEGRQAQLESAQCQFAMEHRVSQTPEMSLTSLNLVKI